MDLLLESDEEAAEPAPRPAGELMPPDVYTSEEDAAETDAAWVAAGEEDRGAQGGGQQAPALRVGVMAASKIVPTALPTAEATGPRATDFVLSDENSDLE